MALIDRLARTGTDKIAGHLFEAALWLWLRGHITQTQLANYFNLDVTDTAKLLEFQTAFNSRSPAAEKIAYFSDVTAALVGLQQGAIDQVKFKTIVGIT